MRREATFERQPLLTVIAILNNNNSSNHSNKNKSKQDSGVYSLATVDEELSPLHRQRSSDFEVINLQEQEER
jgi:hypothetical protein